VDFSTNYDCDVRGHRINAGRRSVLRTLALTAITTCSVTRAQPADRIRRIGWLTLVNNYGPARNRALNLVRERLAELGWVDGRNIIIEPRWAENQPQRLPALAAELIALRVDVIVTQTNPATLVAKAATTRIPIVMTGVTQPVNSGIVSSLARPGGNVTGVTDNPGPGFVTKMAQLLMEAAPRVSRLAILGSEFYMSELEPAGPRLGIEVIRAPASTYREVPGALAGALRDRADGLFVLATSVNDPNRQAIVDFALAHRWPAIGGDRTFAAAGGLMSYWTDWNEVRRQTADYVDKILRGANPGDLPIQQPTKFELVLNLRTAQRLGLPIPQSLRLRADELI
jgi:putative tryptophan/tyrosine transport system substrate-binding protein